MRWSIIRLIWFRELLDQLRDRRTLGMMVGLPLLLYPLLSALSLNLTFPTSQRPFLLGVVRGPLGTNHFPEPPATGPLPAAVLAPLAAMPVGLEGQALFQALSLQAGWQAFEFPLLISAGQLNPEFALAAGKDTPARQPVRVIFLESFLTQLPGGQRLDVVLEAPSHFFTRLEAGDRPILTWQPQPHDEAARQGLTELTRMLIRWRQRLRETILHRHGLPGALAEPFEVKTPTTAETESSSPVGTNLVEMLLKLFPFMLVLWSLVGALYPAVDLCAGEKERGTMETLLISPASREEIVWGKFLTIWLFSLLTAVMNLVGMAVSALWFSDRLGGLPINFVGLVFCGILVLPLGALFGAVTLAIGAYARSSKEGQYYLMPLFLVVMPLNFLTLAPGVDLNPFYSMVPVTGVALLMQEFLGPAGLGQVRWFYFLPVFATVALYSWLALRWAIAQFQREEVLFREADRLDLRLWVRHLLRDKEPRPSLGHALFCFVVLLGLRWLSFDVGLTVPVEVRRGVLLLAFVAAPPLLIAALLTTRPRLSLGLRWPPAGYLLIAVLLLPALELAHLVLTQVEPLAQLVRERREFIQAAIGPTASGSWLVHTYQYALLLLLPVFCQELAFRGLILTGLRRRLHPWPAILLGAFLFALYYTNVFLLLPTFILGVFLGLLAVRSGSILPGLVLHLGSNALLLGGPVASGTMPREPLFIVLLTVLALLATLLASLLFRQLPGADAEPIGPGKR